VYSIYLLNAADRLKDILMKDYKMVDAAIKELALVNYYQLTGDIKLIKAFTYNKLANLNIRAAELLNGDITNASFKTQLNNELSDVYHLNSNELVYLINWALPNSKALQQLNVKKKKETNPYLVSLDINEACIIDGLAVALLISQGIGSVTNH